MRLMLDLAEAEGGKPMSIKEISKRENISDKYLEQIIAILNTAGFVRSIRGAQGGYVLKRLPGEYTVGMILRLTEGSLAPVACVEEETDCQRMEICPTVKVWRRLNDAINGVVDHITLADLVEWENDGSNYVI